MKLAKVLLIITLVLGAVGCGNADNKNETETPVTDLDIKQEK